MMNECFDFLLEKGFNPEAENLEHGETMMYYSLIRGKIRSFEKLLDYFEKNRMTPKIGSNMMSPIAATVIKPNFQYFERLYRLHDSNID